MKAIYSSFIFKLLLSALGGGGCLAWPLAIFNSFMGVQFSPPFARHTNWLSEKYPNETLVAVNVEDPRIEEEFSYLARYLSLLR